MTQDRTNDPGTLLPSLRVKLQEFTDSLTPEGQGQFGSGGIAGGVGTLSPAFRAKAQQAADGLTAEEKTQVRALLRHMDAEAGVKEDTLGQMIKEERVEPMPEGVGGGGGGLLGLIGGKVWEHSGIPDAWRAISYFL